MVAVSVMLATFMVVLDSSIANVALPHIAGSLSASTDESTWVLTSYLVSNGIMLPASGWLSRRIGRKRLLMLSILAFTAASILCGMALNMPMLIVARVLQGAGGGGMQPLAQSILLESFPPDKHGKRWPPTESASWSRRSSALLSADGSLTAIPGAGSSISIVPVGLLALFMANLFIEDPPYLRQARRVAIDAIGFAFMAVWLGSLQLVLDKGQEADWFEATWIRWLTALSVAMFLAFIARELLCRDPIVQLHILLDRNFRTGTLITGLFGVLLYGVTAFLPLFLQTLLGYSAMDSGLAVSPRGLGSMLAMVVVGSLINRFDSRFLLAFGMAIFAVSTFYLSRVNLGISMGAVAWPNFWNGFGGGFVFVPLTTLAMGRLRKQEMGNAAGIYNLIRNIGGSVGIAALTANQVRGAQIHQSYMSANLTASSPAANNALQGLATRFQTGGANAVLAHREALGAIYGSLQQQAAVLAYADNFRFLGYLALGCIPLALFLKRPRHDTREIAGE